MRHLSKPATFGALCGVLWMISAGIGSAGDTEGAISENNPERGRIAWRGGPLPKYRAIILTEAGLLWRASSGAVSHNLITAELGTLINIERDYALGGTLYFGYRNEDGHHDGQVFGIKARYRRWFRGVGLDIAPGILIAGGGFDRSDHVSWPGFTGHVGLSFGDWVTLTAQVDVVRHSAADVSSEPLERNTNTYVGVKFGSYLGVLVSIAAAIVAAIVSLSGGIDVGY